MIVYVIQKNGGNNNSPSSLNIMANRHYHGENWVITRQLPSCSSKNHHLCHPASLILPFPSYHIYADTVSIFTYLRLQRLCCPASPPIHLYPTYFAYHPHYPASLPIPLSFSRVSSEVLITSSSICLHYSLTFPPIILCLFHVSSAAVYAIPTYLPMLSSLNLPSPLPMSLPPMYIPLTLFLHIYPCLLLLTPLIL